MRGWMTFTMAAIGAATPAAVSAEDVLVMFERQFCEWCDLWNEEIGVVYDKTDEGRRAPLRRLDIRDDLDPTMVLDGPVVFTPTFVVLRDGLEIGRITGHPGDDFFWGLLTDILDREDPGS